MVDDELDLTEQMPKTFDEDGGEPAPAPWLPASGDRWEAPAHVAFGTPTNVASIADTVPETPAPTPVTTSPEADLMDWSPPKIETTAPVKLDDSVPVELEPEPEPAPKNESVEFAIPMLDPHSLPPLPKPNMSFARGTTASPTLSLVPRARGSVPPPTRPRTESGLYSLPKAESGAYALPPRPESGVYPLPVQARSDSSAMIPLSKYQAYPVVPETRFDVSDRTFAVRRTRRRPDWGKFAIAGFAGVGLFVGYLAFREDVPSEAKPGVVTDEAHVAAVVPTEAPRAEAHVAAVVPTEAPRAEPAHAETPKPIITKIVAAPAPVVETKPFHVPITSSPDGATVTLVEDGNAHVIGTTPLFATIQPGHTYDVVLVLKDHPTVVRHIDTKSEHAIAITLSGAAPAHTVSAPTAAAIATPAARPTPSARTAPITKSTAPATRTMQTAPAPAVRTPPTAPAPATHATTAPAPRVAVAPQQPVVKLAPGNGMLMISAKPPCQIAIDGKLTKLVTPQNAIAMLAGMHKIALINAQSRINWTVDVKIAAGQPTKLIQDFTKKK